MTNNTLNYAKAYIDVIAKENEIKTFISQGNLYIELRSGRNFKLSEDEVKYQAIQFLEDEINQINQQL